jgi:putative ABC transport system substrate-binding protein
MRRREFLGALSGAAVAWPLATHAQQSPMPVVGFLGGPSASGWARYVAAFLQGLGEAGYVDGRNVAIEYRWAEGQYERLPALAADLVQRRVSVIAAATTPAVLAAKAATSTIPIVFVTISNPVQIGLVASLNRPGGNLTGATQLDVEIGPKLIELLHEVLPAATNIALLFNPANPTIESQSRNLQAAARTLGLNLDIVHAGTEHDIDATFATLAKRGTGGLVIGGDSFFNTRSEQLAALALRHRLPTIYQSRVFAAAGGLMSYGGDSVDVYRLIGVYTGRILKGDKPADLPVLQATKVEMIVNLKTAKLLGLTIPMSLLGRADEVIE